MTDQSICCGWPHQSWFLHLASMPTFILFCHSSNLYVWDFCVCYIWICPCMCVRSRRSAYCLKRPLKHVAWLPGNETFYYLKIFYYANNGETWPRSSPSSSRIPETDMSRPRFEPPTSCTADGHSSKELSWQINAAYSETLQLTSNFHF